jgi:acyl-CoA synthetase (AMP-forming)/AMP-acid ligase II
LSEPFPFGVRPEGADPNRDARGFDSVNRLLLHGARYHDREAVFIEVRDGVQLAVPDFRVDRNTVRIALALLERGELATGARIAVVLPSGSRLAAAERAVWAMGGVSLVVDPRVHREERERAIDAAHCRSVYEGEAGIDELIEQGSVLDTPERAATVRQKARDVPSAALASLEVELRGSTLELHRHSQGDWAQALQSLSELYPPRKAARIVSRERPRPSVRALIFAGWADGLTRTVIANDGVPNELVRALQPSTVVELEADRAGNARRGFANLRDTNA